MKFSELISKIIVTDRKLTSIDIVNVFEESIGKLVVEDFDWLLVSNIKIDVFRADVIEICFYPVTLSFVIMIDNYEPKE